jgi:hypothetical protein
MKNVVRAAMVRSAAIRWSRHRCQGRAPTRSIIADLVDRIDLVAERDIEHAVACW